MLIRGTTLFGALCALVLVGGAGCGHTGPIGSGDDAGSSSDGGTTTGGSGDGGTDAGSAMLTFSIQLTTPTPTREEKAGFTVSACADVAAVLVNTGDVPTPTDSAWQTCTTASNGITAPLVGGLNQLRVWAKGTDGVITDVPPLVTVVRNSMFSMGDSHSCALVAGAVWCWGDNSVGQLGNGSMAMSSPVAVPVTGLDKDVLEISGAPHAFHTCALKTDGTVWCWGRNEAGQIGNPSVPVCNAMVKDCNTHSPVQVVTSAGQPLTGVTQVSLGASFTCARLQSGQVECWGADYWGQALVGTLNNALVAPTPAVGLPDTVTSVVGGTAIACALSPSGAFCSGLDYTNSPPTTFGPQAALIDGNPMDDVVGMNGYQCHETPAVPKALADLGVPDQIAPGFHHACALAHGSVHCWGANYLGEYGDGTTTPSLSGGAPGLMGTQDLIVSGAHHSCARGPGGTVSCWGMNDFGQLGAVTMEQCSDAKYACSTKPVTVTGLENVAALGAGRKQSCAATAGQVWCWGGNEVGELGAVASDNCALNNAFGTGAPLLCSYTPLHVVGIGAP